MGIETEYGISAPGDPTANPMLLSGHGGQRLRRAVGVLARPRQLGLRGRGAAARRARLGAGPAGWPTRASSPTSRTRPWPTSCSPTAPASTSTTPTRSTPRRRSPRPATPCAGTGRGSRSCSRRCAGSRRIPACPAVHLYKNNTDGKGASYGTHENYLMRRETPFGDIVRHLTPFFVARQVICGAGRVGIGQDSTSSGFQIAQRADFFEVEVGLETTLKRPIINTRDEPHAVADLYRRLHVIIGDANQCDVANLLKLGTTTPRARDHRGPAPSPRTWRCSKPVATLHAVSHDPTLQHARRAARRPHDDGGAAALDLPRARRPLPAARHAGELDADTAEVMQRWSRRADPARASTRCSALARSTGWPSCALLQGFRDRDGLEWTDHAGSAPSTSSGRDVRPEKGAVPPDAQPVAGSSELVSDEDVKQAVEEPPEDTRAYFRGTLPEAVRRRASSPRRGTR